MSLHERPAHAPVGEAIPHESAALHVTGHALYTDDLGVRLQNLLHAWPVQSPHAHARVTGVDTTPALDVPGDKLGSLRGEGAFGILASGRVVLLPKDLPPSRLAALFTIGAVGVLIRRNAIVVFMCVELMLNAVNLSLVTFSRTTGTLDGQIMAFFVMVVAAAEVVIGLAIIMSIYRTRRSASVDDANLLKY